jgi:hypothetical protein
MNTNSEPNNDETLEFSETAPMTESGIVLYTLHEGPKPGSLNSFSDRIRFSDLSLKRMNPKPDTIELAVLRPRSCESRPKLQTKPRFPPPRTLTTSTESGMASSRNCSALNQPTSRSFAGDSHDSSISLLQNWKQLQSILTHEEGIQIDWSGQALNAFAPISRSAAFGAKVTSDNATQSVKHESAIASNPGGNSTDGPSLLQWQNARSRITDSFEPVSNVTELSRLQ